MSYVTVKLPKELIDSIDETIEQRKDLGYKSRPEFIKEAIRRRLEEVKAVAHEEDVSL